jgi:hypothetical protein
MDNYNDKNRNNKNIRVSVLGVFEQLRVVSMKAKSVVIVMALHPRNTMFLHQSRA